MSTTIIEYDTLTYTYMKDQYFIKNKFNNHSQIQLGNARSIMIWNIWKFSCLLESLLSTLLLSDIRSLEGILLVRLPTLDTPILICKNSACSFSCYSNCSCCFVFSPNFEKRISRSSYLIVSLNFGFAITFIKLAISW